MGAETTRVERFAMVCLVSAGWFFRARGMLFGERLEMWNDEASWAMRMFERPLSEHMIRPPGYVVFSRLSASLLGSTEFSFRLLPWLAGMASPLVALLLARRFLRNAAARVLFVGVICLSLNAVDFSKEFKQYSIGLLLQLLLPLLALRWMATKSRRDLIVVCAVAPLGLMFSQDVMFLYPGLFLALFVEAWRSGDRRRSWQIMGAGAATLALVVGMYVLVWSRIPKDKAESHWGKRYDVFYLEQGSKKAKHEQRGAWLANKYADMAAMPGARRDFWSSERLVDKQAREQVALVDWGVWLVLHAMGLLGLVWSRNWRGALLFWSPVLVCVTLNLLGRWPIGAFRTNLFLLAGMAAVASLAFEWYRPVQAKLASLLPVGLLVVAPLLVFERDWHAQKPGVYAAGTLALLKELSTKRGRARGKEPLYMDIHACQPFRYYTKYHPDGVRLWQGLERKLEPVCSKKQKRLVASAAKRPKKSRVWLLIAGRIKVPRTLKVSSRVSKLSHTLIEARVR
jgi:hypothetical protein